MARIPAKEMAVRVKALQDILEDTPEGMRVMDIVKTLEERGVELPASKYQAVNTILKNAEKNEVAVKRGKKWLLLDEVGEDAPATETETEGEATPAQDEAEAEAE